MKFIPFNCAYYTLIHLLTQIIFFLYTFQNSLFVANYSLLCILFDCFCVFFHYSFTVPVRPRRMVRETFTFDAVNSNTISNGELTIFFFENQVHLLNSRSFVLYIVATCFRDGVEVQKSSVTCEIKTGCRLLQKTGQCCPDYQCG